jgi:hypothetical protein
MPSGMLIHIFSPINVREINLWLRENPGIRVVGFSVAAGADQPGELHPPSICAVLYELPATPDISDAIAAVGAEELIESVTEGGLAEGGPPKPRVATVEPEPEDPPSP